MNFIHHSKVNPKIVEQLEESHSRIKFTQPIFEHHEKIERYIDTLEHEDENMRESMVKSWLEPILKRVIDPWKDKFSYNSNIIQNAMSEKTILQEERGMNDRRVHQVEADMQAIDNEIFDIESREATKNNTLVEGKVNWKAERQKVAIFITSAMLIAIFAFFSYMKSSKDNYWLNEASTDTKIGIIEKIAFDDKGDVLSKYKSLIREGFNEDTKEKTFTFNPTKVEASGSDIISVWQYIKGTGGEGFILGLSAVILLLGGKILSVIYEKAGYKPKFFYIVSSFAMLVVILGIVLGTISKGGLDKVSDSRAQLVKIETKLEKAERYLSARQKTPGNRPQNLIILDEEIEKLTTLLDEAKSTSGTMKSLSTLIVFFAEVLVGAVAWMILADYHRKETLSNGGEEGLLQNLSKIKQIKYDKREALVNNRKILVDENILAAGLISRLGTLLADIQSTGTIASIAETYKQEEFSYANQALSAAKHRWKTKAIQV